MKKRNSTNSASRKLPSLSAVRPWLVLGTLAAVLSMSVEAAAAVFYSSEFVSGVSMAGVASLNAHLHSTSSLTWTATFDYGLTGSYGTTAAGSSGANNVPRFFDGNIASVAITGLTCGTTYHWAVVVAGAHDTDQTFTTTACPAPAISTSPSTGGYGPVAVGATVQQTFTISNPGNLDLTVSGVTLGGHQPGEFDVSRGTCASLSPTIAAGKSCAIVVAFSPETAGRKTAILQIPSNAGTVNVALSGSGLGSGNVPTLSEWGTILLALAFATVLVFRAREDLGATPA
jgi:hypothetical protein